MLCPQLPSVSSPTDLVDSGVNQTPKYLIKPRKQQAILRCSPASGHRSVYWYQQVLGQGPNSSFSISTGKRMRKETYQIDSQENSSMTLALS